MNSIIAFISGMAATFLVSFTVIWFFSPHLKKVLSDLCGTEERARFWTVFSNLLIILTPMLTAINYYPSRCEGSLLFFEIVTQFKWGMVGLIGSLVIIGIVIKRYIPANSLQKAI